MDGTLHHITRTTSTQQEARRLITEGKAKHGDIVVADEQTAGRGRFGRSWISPRGGLYATIILFSDPMLSLKAGLALVRVLRSVGINAAGLKWPNDVLVDDRKIAGTLIETDGEFALVGIGLNLTSAPLDTATCVACYAEQVNRDKWAKEIVGALIGMLRGGFDLDEYRDVCLTLGNPVRIEGVGCDSVVEGIAVDVDERGRLIVKTRTGSRVVSSGECLHLCESNSNS